MLGSFFGLYWVFFQVLSIIHINILSPIHVRNFWSNLGFLKKSKNEFWYCWATEFSVQNILLHTQAIFGIFSIDFHKNRQKIPILSMLNPRLKCPRFHDMGISWDERCVKNNTFQLVDGFSYELGSDMSIATKKSS